MSDVIPVMRPWLGPDEAAAAAEAIASGWVAQGPRVRRFEEALAARVGTADAVAASSCTTALHLALVLLGIGPGDEVLVPSLSFIATANVVRYVGAKPVFVDVDEETQNVTAKTLEPAITARTRAVIAVDQCGMPLDLDDIDGLCGPRGITVLEDAACAMGSTYEGRPVGARGELVCFSFHPRKIITTGEGGVLVTSSAELAARARRLREHGMSVSAAERHASQRAIVESYLETGFNYRMTDIQAAVGLVQLAKLDAIVERRRALAAQYRSLLEDVEWLRLPRDPSWGTTNFQSYSVVLDDDLPVDRDEVLGRLADLGVSARRGIMASHLEPAYEGVAHGPLPVTERLTQRSLILPLFHEMTELHQQTVVDALLAAATL
jgi:perosamine synthetase